MTATDLHDWLSEFDWSEPRTVKGVSGTMQVLDMVEPPDKEFWNLWRDHKSAMKAIGVAPSKDEDTDEWTVSWFQAEGSVPIHRAPLAPMVKVQNVLSDDGKGTLDPSVYALLKPRQRLAATTLHTAYQAGHPFALDASELGTGKTFHALAVAKTIGLNVGVVCPAAVVEKWVNTSIDFFDLELEFALSYDKARSGRQEPFVTRHNLARGGAKFEWNAFEPVVLIFDEVHWCNAPDSLNSALLHAAIINPNIFTLGLSGTAANSPVQMKVLGQALGLHQGHDWWKWALANGCFKNPFNGLEFSTNKQKAIIFLSAIHGKIFPHRGCRLLKSDDKGDGVPPHVIFTTEVDAPEVPKSLLPYLEEITAKEVEDEAKADKKDEDVLPVVEQIRSRQKDELALVQYCVDQVNEAIEEGQSVCLFVGFEGTIKALGELLAHHQPMFYKGSTSKDTKRENLRQFQAGVKPLLILNIGAGSEGIDCHDVLGTRPRYSIIFPTYKARQLLQASGRTDRVGKKSVSTCEIIFRNVGIHIKMRQNVQRKINCLALLTDGEACGLDLTPEEK